MHSTVATPNALQPSFSARTAGQRAYLEHLAEGGEQRDSARVAAAHGAAGVGEAQAQDGGVHPARKLALCHHRVNIDLLQQPWIILDKSVREPLIMPILMHLCLYP